MFRIRNKYLFIALVFLVFLAGLVWPPLGLAIFSDFDALQILVFCCFFILPAHCASLLLGKLWPKFEIKEATKEH